MLNQFVHLIEAATSNIYRKSVLVLFDGNTVSYHSRGRAGDNYTVFRQNSGDFRGSIPLSSITAQKQTQEHQIQDVRADLPGRLMVAAFVHVRAASCVRRQPGSFPRNARKAPMMAKNNPPPSITARLAHGFESSMVPKRMPKKSNAPRANDVAKVPKMPNAQVQNMMKRSLRMFYEKSLEA
jgi:hypothetical protein